MSGTYDLQINTVYSATDAAAGGVPTSLRLRLVALLTLLAAGGWLYVTWEPALDWIERRVMIGGGVLMLGSMPLDPMNAGASTNSGKKETSDRAAASDAATAQHQAESQVRNLAVLSAGWLGLTSLTGLWLVMSGSAGLVRARFTRILAYLLAPLVLVATAGLIWYVDREYGEYGWLETVIPEWFWPALEGLVIGFFLVLGQLLNRRPVGLLRLGGVLIVLASAATVIALHLAFKWGGNDLDPPNTLFCAKLFGIQSAFGWLLLVATLGLRSR